MIPKQRINLVKRQDKKKYAVIDGVQNVLIDDYLKNIKEWESAGENRNSPYQRTN